MPILPGLSGIAPPMFMDFIMFSLVQAIIAADARVEAIAAEIAAEASKFYG